MKCAGIALAAGIALQGGRLAACGGAFARPGWKMGSNDQLLQSPDSNFDVLLHKALPSVLAAVLPKDVPAFRAQQSSSWEDPTYEMTQSAAVSDLQSALAALKLPPSRQAAIVKHFEAAREQVAGYHKALTAYQKRLIWMNPEQARQAKAKLPTFTPPKVPADLPPEFDLYLRGAIAWYAHDLDAARQQWRAVLALPPAQRKYRSVWAAYMLGRSYVGIDAKQVADWMRQTRKLAQAGFADSTGLAAASFGWQAKAVYKTDRLAAIRLYARQWTTGDQSAAPSLRVCAHRIMQGGDADLDWAARHPLPRAVMTAHLVAGRSSLWMASDHTGRSEVQRWLAALERADIHNLTGAGRLAWAAYRTGLMNEAQRWADRAPRDDAIACWIRAKLLLRRGKLDKAAGELATALHQPSPPAEAPQRLQRYWQRYNDQMGDDLASLDLSHQQYVQAMDLLVTHHREGSAAYIAERVLNTDELIRYVDARLDKRAVRGIKNLLARRLVREGRWKEARKYFNADKRGKLDTYIAAIRRGHDRHLSRADRADAFWTAAVLAERDGVALMGYATAANVGAKSDGTFHSWWVYPRTTGGQAYSIAPASADERRRAARHRPGDHWNYLYQAVAHAWSACELMPDNDPRTAQRLCDAGTWIKYRDPQAADRFYKALVHRCGNTKLGEEAKKLHWFPKATEP